MQCLRVSSHSKKVAGSIPGLTVFLCGVLHLSYLLSQSGCCGSEAESGWLFVSISGQAINWLNLFRVPAQHIDSRGLWSQVQDKQQEMDGWVLLSCKLFLALLINNFNIFLKKKKLFLYYADQSVLLNSLRSLTRFKILLTLRCLVRFYLRYIFFKINLPVVRTYFARSYKTKQTKKAFMNAVLTDLASRRVCLLFHIFSPPYFIPIDLRQCYTLGTILPWAVWLKGRCHACIQRMQLKDKRQYHRPPLHE